MKSPFRALSLIVLFLLISLATASSQAENPSQRALEIQEKIKKDPSAENYLLLCHYLGQAGDYEGGMSALKEAMKLKPLFVFTIESVDREANYLNDEGVDIMSDNPTGAIKYLEKAIELEPDNSAFHNNLAWACRKAGYMERAEAEFKKSIELSPVFCQSFGSLGSLYFDMKIYEKARFYMNAYLIMQPKDPFLRQMKDKIDRIDRYLEQKKKESAEPVK